jgi:photosystem II stability/assembly factor-like uncharacterized protein
VVLPFEAQGIVPFAVEPTSGDLLAVGDGVMWRRSDDEWRPEPGSGEIPRLQELRADPAAADVLYGVSFEGAVWRSDDGGQAWDRLGLRAHGGSPVRALAVRPGGIEAAAELYGCACGGAAAGNLTSILYALAGDTLYRSIDQGETWYPLVTQGIDAGELGTIAIDPVIPEVMYATLGSGRGVVRSLDGGRVWRALGTDKL